MKLVDGKFFEGDKEVALEFGNKEQIRLMNEQLNMVNALNNDGLTVDPDIETFYKASVTFKCLCGCWIKSKEKEIDDDEDFAAVDELKGEILKCHKCGKKYHCDVNEYMELVVKIKK